MLLGGFTRLAGIFGGPHNPPLRTPVPRIADEELAKQQTARAESIKLTQRSSCRVDHGISGVMMMAPVLRFINGVRRVPAFQAPVPPQVPSRP